MDHKLHPIVRVDADMSSATVELHGCLTLPATSALVSILSKGRSFNPNLALRLDLSHARHIDEDCLMALHLGKDVAGTERAVGTDVDARIDRLGPVKVTLPQAWPVCPVEKAFAESRRRELHV